MTVTNEGKGLGEWIYWAAKSFNISAVKFARLGDKNNGNQKLHSKREPGRQNSNNDGRDIFRAELRRAGKYQAIFSRLNP